MSAAFCSKNHNRLLCVLPLCQCDVCKCSAQCVYSVSVCSCQAVGVHVSQRGARLQEIPFRPHGPDHGVGAALQFSTLTSSKCPWVIHTHAHKHTHTRHSYWGISSFCAFCDRYFSAYRDWTTSSFQNEAGLKAIPRLWFGIKFKMPSSGHQWRQHRTLKRQCISPEGPFSYLILERPIHLCQSYII